MIDTSGRMGAGLVGHTALDRAVETAALVTRYSLLRGDKVGLLLTPFPPGEFVPVGRGTDVAAAIRKGLTGAAPGPVAFDPALAFDSLGPRLSRPAHLLMFMAPSQWTERDTFALRNLVGRGHRPYFFLPDLPAMYPEPPDETSRRTAALVDSPEHDRRDRVAAAIEALGAPLFLYGRDGPVEAMADLADRIRGFRRGS